MQFRRFMSANEFVRELAHLRAFRGEYMGTGLLESLEQSGLLLPRLRIRYPDQVARRFWLIAHEHWSAELNVPSEPDGPRWEAAVALSDALYRWQHASAYGLSPHPLDDPELRFEQFLQRPAEVAFERRLDRRVEVSNRVHTPLFDDCNVEDYYATWQLLLAAEVADAGISMRINLADAKIAQDAHDALQSSRIPSGTGFSFNFLPVHAARDFARHEMALNAVVWFAEERGRALEEIIKGQGGRFRLSPEQSQRYDAASRDIAHKSAERFNIDVDNLVAAIRFLAERWSDWKREGRPAIADAYKAFLERAVIFSRRLGDLSFSELRARVGVVGGWFKPMLDVIWPDWVEEEKERVRLTLRSAISSDKAKGISEGDIDAFVAFLADEGLEAFFWRLRSFEDHALRGNSFAVEGMKSDIQGMALAVEHVAATLGATETQLYEKFKQLWRDPDVLRILKRGDVAPLARQASLAKDWLELKSRIEALRTETGGMIAADLVMAHRIRGGAHAILGEDDHFELEGLFVGLMRAAMLTFVEVRRHATAKAAGSDAA